jgi:RecA/RadA recombinase
MATKSTEAVLAPKKDYMAMFQKDERNLKGSEVVSKGRVMTPSPSLDWATNGGFYRGYTVCLYGPEGSGKSFLSMVALGSLMKFDPEAMGVTISTEFRAPTPSRVAKLGVDGNRHMIREANTVHDVFDWICSDDSNFENSDGTKGAPGLLYMLKEGAPIKALIIDSIKGIAGPKELKSESSEKDIMGDLSKYLNPSLRSILPVIRKYNLMTIFVQQVNENMNPDEVKYQGIRWKVPSGQALKHFCENMILVEKVIGKETKLFSDSMNQSREIPVQEGHSIRVRVDKANLDAPFREAEFQIKYNKGMVNSGLEVAKLATGVGVIYHPLSATVNKKTGQREPNNQLWAVMLDDKEVVWEALTKTDTAPGKSGYDVMVDDLEAKPELQRKIMAAVHEKTG